MSKVSKNQRAGVRQKHAPHICPKGHTQVYTMIQPMKGRRKFRWQCACTGYEPINTTLPYAAIHPRIKAAGGKSRVWYERRA